MPVMSSQNETIGAKGQFSDFKYQILEKPHSVFGIPKPFYLTFGNVKRFMKL